MTNPPAARRAASPTRWQLGWLLILLGAVAGALLALLEGGLWLIFASGSLATWAVVGLVRGKDAAPVSLVRHAESGWAYLRTELARSRRHDRSFALIGIPDEVWFPPSSGTAERDDVALAVAADIQRFLRRPDRAWVDGSRLYIVLTDSDRERGLAFLARVRVAMPELFGDDRVRLVVFPDDGITSDALLAGLDGQPEKADSEATPATAA
jgi:hypothetical protein